jgi:hypothetical protein
MVLLLSYVESETGLLINQTAQAAAIARGLTDLPSQAESPCHWGVREKAAPEPPVQDSIPGLEALRRGTLGDIAHKQQNGEESLCCQFSAEHPQVFQNLKFPLGYSVAGQKLSVIDKPLPRLAGFRLLSGAGGDQRADLWISKLEKFSPVNTQRSSEPHHQSK